MGVTPLAGRDVVPTPAGGADAVLGAAATVSGAVGTDGSAHAPAVVVLGPAIDAETRCVHYGSPLDVVALRAPCCDAWYPCHLCHAAVADHPLQVIPRSEHRLPAALCGVCRTTMSVPEYRAAESCPSCGAAFNPGCTTHAHLYFAP
ncbi:CHY zinc finger [Clavibacter michiganensis subsp. michiganensis]|nr:CHY zinc finger protein [Clavibacter michiganensis]OUD98232.1 CHY zinc finger [Clavibacter michiganensis subsp. michiganensis]OUE02199.1 CHY zinc finger [Clavibacter michiganensis subsp. michiganensis]